MPSDKFSAGVTQLFDKELQRIRAITDPIEREQEARDLSELLRPYREHTREVRSGSIRELLDGGMTVRQASLVLGLARNTIFELKVR